MREIEAKIRVGDHVDVQDVISALSIEHVQASSPVLQEDYVYAEDVKVITDALPGSVVARVRVEHGRSTLTVKQRRNSELDRLEYETAVEDMTTVGKILELFGLSLLVKVRKTRQTIGLEPGVTVLLDRVDGLGSFIEIEVLSDDATRDQRLAALVAILQHAAFDLGIEQRGYDTLLLLAGDGQQ